MFSIAAATLLAVAAPQATVVQAFTLQGASRIVLDGRHYALPAGAFTLQSDGHYYLSPTLAMGNCVRANGQAQVITKNALRWNGVRVVYLAPTSPISLRYAAGTWQVIAASATGDLACEGEVAQSGVVFGNGFE